MAEEVTLSHNSPFISLRYTLQHHLHEQCAFWFEVDSAAGSSHGLQIGIDWGIPHLHEFGSGSLISGSHGTICRCIEHLWPWNSSGYGSNLGWGLNILTCKKAAKASRDLDLRHWKLWQVRNYTTGKMKVQWRFVIVVWFGALTHPTFTQLWWFGGCLRREERYSIYSIFHVFHVLRVESCNIMRAKQEIIFCLGL